VLQIMACDLQMCMAVLRAQSHSWKPWKPGSLCSRTSTFTPPQVSFRPLTSDRLLETAAACWIGGWP
jgi:hypothetical protein